MFAHGLLLRAFTFKTHSATTVQQRVAKKHGMDSVQERTKGRNYSIICAGIIVSSVWFWIVAVAALTCTDGSFYVSKVCLKSCIDLWTWTDFTGPCAGTDLDIHSVNFASIPSLI